jgi:hypothetical protein
MFDFLRYNAYEITTTLLCLGILCLVHSVDNLEEEVYELKERISYLERKI